MWQLRAKLKIGRENVEYLSSADCSVKFKIRVSKSSAGSDHQERTLSRVLCHCCQKRELAWTISSSLPRDFFHCQRWRSSSWMSLPKTYSFAHSGWRQLTRVAELFSPNQGLVFPSQLECLPCSLRKTIKTAGKRGDCIMFKFFAVLFTNFNNKMQVDCWVQSVVSVVDSSNLSRSQFSVDCLSQPSSHKIFFPSLMLMLI